MWFANDKDEAISKIEGKRSYITSRREKYGVPKQCFVCAKTSFGTKWTYNSHLITHYLDQFYSYVDLCEKCFNKLKTPSTGKKKFKMDAKY